MDDVTSILASLERGEPVDADRLLPLVYDELRRMAAAKMARERPGHTLDATGLVHEAYLRLVDADRITRWESRRHFFGAAAEAMRRILINRARDGGRLKRGGGRLRVDLSALDLAADSTDEDLLALDEALQRFEQEDPVGAELVKLRFFAGLGQGDAAKALDLPRRTADRYWAFARAWLFDALGPGS